MEIMTYQEVIVSLVNLNGIINETETKKIFKRYFSSREVFSKEYLTNHLVQYENGLFVHQSIYQTKYCKELEQAKKQFHYYIPTESELHSYHNPDYILKNNVYQKILTYLTRLLGNQKKANDLLVILATGVRIDSSLEGIEVVLVHKKIHLKKEELSHLLYMFEEYKDDVRTWLLNGFTPKELRLSNQDKIVSNEVNISEEHKDYIDAFRTEERKILYFTANFKLPSLQDLLEDTLRLDPLYIKNRRPKDIVGSLLFLLCRMHGYNFTENRQERVLKSLRIYGKRVALEEYSYELEERFFSQTGQYSSKDLVGLIESLYYSKTARRISSIPKNKPFEFLKTVYKEIPYNEDTVLEFEDLALQVLLNNDVNQLVLLYQISVLCPYLPFVLYEFLPHYRDNVQKVVLESIIFAYETRYKKELLKPRNEFTLDGENKIYVLSLDMLGLIYKNSGRYQESIDLYEKAISCDKENKYGCKESILVNYLLIHDLDGFFNRVKKLKKGSLYNVFIGLLVNLSNESRLSFEYKKALRKSRKLLDAICLEDLNIIGSGNVLELGFAHDFLPFFTANKEGFLQLRSIHLRKSTYINRCD